MGNLSPDQRRILQITERTASVFSIVGCVLICVTFVRYAQFRKPINRLMFYASWGNLFFSVAALLSQTVVDSPNSALCQFQGFVVQL